MKCCSRNGLRGIVLLALLGGAAATRAQNATASPDGSVVQVPARQVPAAAGDLNNSEENPVVVEVRVVAEDGRVLQRPVKGISVAVGTPLDARKWRRACGFLYRTGDYADLSAAVTEVSGGVRLDFVAHENLFFNQVLIKDWFRRPVKLRRLRRRNWRWVKLTNRRIVGRSRGSPTGNVAAGRFVHRGGDGGNGAACRNPSDGRDFSREVRAAGDASEQFI